jgi:hypothetical protein
MQTFRREMSSSPCCVGRKCGQWSVGPRGNVNSTLSCSPTSEPLIPWSAEMPSFDSPVTSTNKIAPPVRLLGDPVMSGKKIIQPVRLLRDPVISAKKTKIVPPVRLSGGRNYVDASKFNRNYLQQNAHSMTIPKCGSPHLSSDALWVIDRRQDRSVTPSCSPMCDEDAKWSAKMPDYDNMDCVSDDDGKLQEAKVESLRSVVVPHIDNIVENEDALNTTVSSACNYVKPKKKRGERITKDAVCGSEAVIFALKNKVRSCNNISFFQ